MPIEQIIRLLRNSGLNVLGADGGRILIEDPTCFTVSVYQLIQYAWVVIAVMTAFLLMGWAFSLIRGGSKVWGIADNLRHLVIIFGALTAVGPIVNFIYGGDLWNKPCDPISVPIDTVQTLLAKRNAKLKTADLAGEIDVMRDMEITLVDPVAFPEIPQSPDMSPAPVPRVAASTSDVVHMERVPGRREVIYTRRDGSRFMKIGGSVAWLQNNPGNLENSGLNRRMGAVDGPRFAIFPDEETGMRAMEAQLRHRSYNNLTVAQAIHRWAPPFENDTGAYQRHVERAIGISMHTPMNALNDAQLRRMVEAMKIKEGWIPGTIREL